MFQLLPREQALIVLILAATLLGFAVQHWRDAHRVQAAAKAAVAPVHRPAQPPLAGGRPGR